MNELHVLFEVDGTEYVLPASDVLQMEAYSTATRVPGTARWVAGLMQVRGRVIPVIDVRLRFGLPPADDTIERRVVVLEKDGRTVGLLVDRAREVVQISPESFQDPPEAMTQQAEGFVARVGKAGERLVLLLNASRIIGEEELHGEQRTEPHGN